jgi:hypothetical protein
MTYTAAGGGGGGGALNLFSTHWWRPYQTRSDVIRIVFSLLMSPSLGGLGRPPAVRWKLAKTLWGRGLICGMFKWSFIYESLILKPNSFSYTIRYSNKNKVHKKTPIKTSLTLRTTHKRREIFASFSNKETLARHKNWLKCQLQKGGKIQHTVISTHTTCNLI